MTPPPITDFHTHAFPDAIAANAMKALLAETDAVRAWRDGTLASLLTSMDQAGIDRSVICSIATKPSQFDPILAWSRQIAGPRIVPLPSIHPADPDAVTRVKQVADAGFAGIKLHPYYQNFFLDDPNLLPLFRALAESQLLVVCHTGYDIAFPRIRRCAPEQIDRLLRTVPTLRLIATHLGAWNDWQEVERLLLGRPLYLDISYSLEELPAERARELILGHPEDYILFGTDSPWQDQTAALARLRGLELGRQREEKMLCENAERLLKTKSHILPPLAAQAR